jgi:predicted restriction endonuclease
MALNRIESIPNGNKMVGFKIYSCDITGEEIPENFGYYGNENVQISENGMGLLLEEWIKNHSNKCGYPIILHYLIERLCERIKPDRYIPKSLREQVLLKYEHKCVKCGSTECLEIDHIHPVSKRGLSEFSNLQVLCKSCNIKKGATI